MQEITKKITDDAIKTFGPVIEQMASEGCDPEKIVNAFGNHVRAKTIEFYRKPAFICIDKLVNAVIEKPADSKAEQILLMMLSDNDIKCIFQRKIGPYTADFIVNERVIIELDGPHHHSESMVKHDTSRDVYLRRMGYEIIRIPIWALSTNTDAIIEEIREASIIKKPPRKPRTKKTG